MTPQEFLSQMAQTATALDFDQHMNLISKDVKVFGIPGFEEIGYEEWFKQCKEEFENKLLKQVTYEGIRILERTPEKIAFKSVETIEATDGFKNTSAIAFIIQKEGDGQWRLSQERILPEFELESYRHSGNL